MSRFWFLAALGAVAARAVDQWAVLVAGSNSFWNYRHQADVCHAYNVLIHRGFDPAKIITMAYDDVAHDIKNPFPGKLYNHPWPTMDNAVDVYAGCNIDYKGKNVTSDRFVAVLTGDQDEAGGKVLASNSNDHVFVNFVDHGGVGLIAFPDGQQVLHARRLVTALIDMHSKGMYKQLTFYLETCESGSMFEGLLPPTLPVYAVTAANAHESSWGTYCGSASKVGGKVIGSCLGDLFSVNWMMDAESYIGGNETFLQQYQRVQQLTNKSHVMQFGDLSLFDGEAISEFEGPGSQAKSRLGAGTAPHSLRDDFAVDSRDIKLDALYHRYTRSGDAADAKALIEEIQAREAVQQLGASIAATVLGDTSVAARLFGEVLADAFVWTLPQATCHERIVLAFGERCGWKEGRLWLSKILYQLCERTSGSASPIIDAINGACPIVQVVV